METKIEWINDPIMDILAGWTNNPLQATCNLTCGSYGECKELCRVVCRART